MSEKKKLDKQMITSLNRIRESERRTQTLGDTEPEEKVWALCQQTLARAALYTVLVLLA